MFVLPIPDVFSSVERPAIHSVVDTLISLHMVPNPSRKEFKDVLLKNAITPNTAKDTQSASTVEGYNASDRLLTVNIDTSSDDPITDWTSKAVLDNRPLFNDRSTGLSITPIYSQVKVNLNLEYSSTSLSFIKLWQSTVAENIRAGMTTVVNNLEYSITLPQGSYVWLEDMHNLIENKYGYGNTLSEYIAKHSLNELTVITSGSTAQLAISEYQIKVYSYMKSPYQVSIEESEPGIYKGSINFEFSYLKPHTVAHRYPIQVHQQIIDAKYMPQVDNSITNGVAMSPLLRGFTTFDKDRGPDIYLRVPSIDNFKLSGYPSYYRPIVTAMIEIDDNDPTMLCSLKELGDVSIDVDVLSVISDSLSDKVTIPYKTIFLVCVHIGNVLLDHHDVSCDTDLNIRTATPMSGRSIYRVSLCITTDFAVIDQSGIDPFNKDDDMVDSIVDTVNVINSNQSKFNKGINVTVIPKDLNSKTFQTTVAPLIKQPTTNSTSVITNTVQGTNYTIPPNNLTVDTTPVTSTTTTGDTTSTVTTIGETIVKQVDTTVVNNISTVVSINYLTGIKTTSITDLITGDISNTTDYLPEKLVLQSGKSKDTLIRDPDASKYIVTWRKVMSTYVTTGG